MRIEIGDWVEILSNGDHDSTHRWYKASETRVSKGEIYQVEDIEKASGDMIDDVVKVGGTAYRMRSVEVTLKVQLEQARKIIYKD